ncbi:MAG: CDP-alcohol phosphatidyltransferase family protein [Candidatus Eisenbacteria bacterium]|nr:CDP-alcohol phosphatidyltransferase family protein [Candidatus Eisenbacteria bacterium]
MFIEEYLEDLRRERFTPRAIVTCARRTAAHARRQIDANPSAVRSVWSVALGFFAAAFVAAVTLALAGERRLAEVFFLETALVIVPTFALVTLHIGLLRDESGYRLSALNVPITLTLMRVVLLPGVVRFVLDRRFALALAAFLLASASDIADGWIARRTRQITRLGTLLDPLFDIVFNLTLFCALARAGLLPAWVAGVATVRYGLLLVGAAGLYVFVGPVRVQPTGFGRMTGVLMAALVGLLMLVHALRGSIGDALLPLTRVALGVLLSATLAQVAVIGVYNLRTMRGKSEATGRVVGDVRWGAR